MRLDSKDFSLPFGINFMMGLASNAAINSSAMLANALSANTRTKF